MAGADKTSSRSQLDTRIDQKFRGSEPKPAGSAREQPKSGVIKKMEKQSGQDPVMVDRWFDRQLNQLYSDVISEPLPKEFLELIEKLKEKEPK